MKLFSVAGKSFSNKKEAKVYRDQLNHEWESKTPPSTTKPGPKGPHRVSRGVDHRLYK